MSQLGTQPDRAPRCHAHPQSAASWYCTLCRQPKCDMCVQSSGLHAGENATCMICGGRCIALPGSAQSRSDAYRGGGLYDHRDVRSDYYRNRFVAPVMLNLLCWTQLFLGMTRNQPADAVRSLAIWLAVGGATLFIAVSVLNHYLQAYFDSWTQRLFKLTAVAMCIHVIQVLLLSGIAATFKDEFNNKVIADIMTQFFPLVSAVLLVPVTVLYVGLDYFFELDSVELAAAVVALFMAYTLMFFVLVMNGVPI